MKDIRLSNLILLVAGLGLTVLGVTLLLIDGSGRDTDGVAITEPETDVEWLAAGENLVKQYNCNFCHRTETPTDAAHLARDNCQQCHQFHDRPENLAPPLESIAERRPEAWIKRYLRYPYRIRQNSHDRMPDLGLTDREINALTRYLVIRAQDTKLPDWKPEREEKPDAERLSNGKDLWDKYACATCHTLGDAIVKPTYHENGKPNLMPVVFAPDLSKAWTRVRPEWLAEAIQHPSKRMPWSGMLQTAMTQTEARELAWYVMNAVPAPKHTVSAGEVMDILRENCNGCHYAPDAEAGPNTNPEGGAGWIATWNSRARKLDLMTLEGLLKGAVDDLGQPRPSVIPYAENSPLLMHVKGLKQPSMPFAADPLTPEQTNKLERWVLSGAPVPRDSGGIHVNPPIEMGDD